MAAAAATSFAGATTGLLPRVQASNCLALPYLPPRSSVGSLRVECRSFNGDFSLCGISSNTFESRRFSSLQVKASSTDESAVDAGELLNDLKEKWDQVENKSTVVLYGGGAVVAVWLSSVIVGAINSVPLLPKLMELVGLGYTGWFVYRYLLFKSSRKELAEDIESLKKKIAGTTE